METTKKLEELGAHVEPRTKARAHRSCRQHERLLKALDTFLEEAEHYYASPELTALFEARRGPIEPLKLDGGTLGRASDGKFHALGQ